MLLSVIALALTVANVFWFATFTSATALADYWINAAAQVLLAALAATGFFSYLGRRTMPAPDGSGVRIWTGRRAFTFLVLVAASGALLLPLGHLIGWGH